jgi:hypothetical protein
VHDATETEIDAYAAEIEKDHEPGNLGAYIAGFAPQQIAEAIARMRESPGTKPGGRGTRRLPCDRGGSGPHSERCRSGDGANCGVEWCECQCHGRPGDLREEAVQ